MLSLSKYGDIALSFDRLRMRAQSGGYARAALAYCASAEKCCLHMTTREKTRLQNILVMAGLVPAIHVVNLPPYIDGVQERGCPKRVRA